jgi:peptide subunit release factor 1 (eRF1)
MELSAEYVTAPETGPPAEDTVNVEGVSVAGFMATLKEAVKTCVSDTLVAPLAGTVTVTVGGTGGAAAVVNVHT